MSISRRAMLQYTAAVIAAGLTPVVARSQDTPRLGGTMTVHLIGENRFFNPALMPGTAVGAVGPKMMEPLVDLDEKGNIVGVLATSWEYAPDGLTVTFHLREGVEWHDGKPFTSADVQYTAMELWKKKMNFAMQLQRNLEAVETPDDHTAIFRYSSPMPQGLLMRGLCEFGFIAPKHIFDNGTDVLENPANVALVGTGPYKYVAYERGQHFIAERNEKYWRDGYPYLDRIVWRIISERSAATAALEAGELLLSPFSMISFPDMVRLRDDPRFEVSSRGSEGIVLNNMLEFNHRGKEMSNPLVRKAIAHSLDLDFLCNEFFYGLAKPAIGVIPSTSASFYDGHADPYPYDVAKAEALLDEAGYPRGADGTRFTLRFVPPPMGEDIPLISAFIQQSLMKVGIALNTSSLDLTSSNTKIYKDWDFDLATGYARFRGDPAISSTSWFRSGAAPGTFWSNQYGWANARVDDLIDGGLSEIDTEKRRAMYIEMDSIIADELPMLMLTERNEVSVTNVERVRNHHTTPRWESSSWYDLWLAS